MPVDLLSCNIHGPLTFLAAIASKQAQIFPIIIQCNTLSYYPKFEMHPSKSLIYIPDNLNTLG